MIKHLAFCTVALGLSAFLISVPKPLQAQSVRPRLTQAQPPNARLEVEQQAGVCPRTLGLWTWFRYYEGGGEHIVIADTQAIAGPTRPVLAQANSVAEYVAPLRGAYLSCVGRASSREAPWYQARFENGSLYFQVDLTALPEGAVTAITYQNVLDARPYVRWAIVD